MARYIDADVLKRKIRVNLMPNVDVDGTVAVEDAERYFLNLIETTSTADVVEVVRCEECVSARRVFACYKCRVTGERHNGGHYCSYGRRRDK